MPNHPAAWPASIRTGWRSGKPCVPSLTDKEKRVLTTTRCGIEACPLAAQHDLSVELRGGSLHDNTSAARWSDILESSSKRMACIWCGKCLTLGKFWMARKSLRGPKNCGEGERQWTMLQIVTIPYLTCKKKRTTSPTLASSCSLLFEQRNILVDSMYVPACASKHCCCEGAC
jgi:hypothetical protein